MSSGAIVQISKGIYITDIKHYVFSQCPEIRPYAATLLTIISNPKNAACSRNEMSFTAIPSLKLSGPPL